MKTEPRDRCKNGDVVIVGSDQGNLCPRSLFPSKSESKFLNYSDGVWDTDSIASHRVVSIEGIIFAIIQKILTTCPDPSSVNENTDIIVKSTIIMEYILKSTIIVEYIGKETEKT